MEFLMQTLVALPVLFSYLRIMLEIVALVLGIKALNKYLSSN
ncbi:hypothetical protein [Anaerosphaera multitolerans]|nr:hypothetical protein [Anaerosphaera multitolerans]